MLADLLHIVGAPVMHELDAAALLRNTGKRARVGEVGTVRGTDAEGGRITIPRGARGRGRGGERERDEEEGEDTHHTERARGSFTDISHNFAIDG